MSWVATAVVGSAVIGGIASNKASKRAAEGQSEALGVSSAASAQARNDANRLFGKAAEERKNAFADTLKFISGAPSKQIEPFQRGNVLAQEQIVRGLPQIQNAILGLPTDLSGFQARNVGAPSSFDFPQFQQEEQPTNTPVPQNILQGKPIGSRVLPRFIRGPLNVGRLQ